MEPQDRQRDRQTAPAVDDADQVGIVEIVVGFAVAAVAVLPRQHVAQRSGPGRAPAADIRGEGGEMAAIGVGVDMRMIEHGKRESSTGEVDLRIFQAADLFQRLKGCADVHGPRIVCQAAGARKRRGSSLIRTWLTTRRT